MQILPCTNPSIPNFPSAMKVQTFSKHHPKSNIFHNEPKSQTGNELINIKQVRDFEARMITLSNVTCQYVHFFPFDQRPFTWIITKRRIMCAKVDYISENVQYLQVHDPDTKSQQPLTPTNNVKHQSKSRNK